MKHLKKLLLLLCLIILGAAKMSAALLEIYVVIDSEDNSMTFFMDDRRSLYEGSTTKHACLINTSTWGAIWFSDPDLHILALHVNKVKFDYSFRTVVVSSTRNWFHGMVFLNTIEGLANLNTSSITDMSGMFSGCERLTSLDLSGKEVFKVTDMSDMFEGCTALTSLNLSGWRTNQLTNINGMFDGCNALTTLDVSGWTNPMLTNMSGMFSNLPALTNLNLTNFNTSAATDMSDMFARSFNITSLDLRGLNVANAVNMGGMFRGCSTLTSLDLSGWNTDNLTSINGMFSGCSSLTNINVSGWTNTVLNNMSNMFNDCSALTSINLTNFNTSAVTSMRGLFSGCSNLTQITYGSNWNTSNVTDMSNMFENCSAFTNLNLSAFSNSTGNVTNMSGMFKGCSNLTGFTYGSSLNTSNVTDMSEMFCGCSSLTSIANIGAGSWNVSKVTSVAEMFSECSSLTSLTLNWDTNSLTNMSGMFSNCSKLTSISFGSNWNTSNVTSMGALYYRCSSLTNGNLTSFNTSSVTSMSYMFAGCSSLTSIDVSSWNTSNVTSMSAMFLECSALTNLVGTNGWDTSKVTGMSGMFKDCNHLTNIDGISKWDTSSLNGRLESTFQNCSAFTSLDLSGWNTSKIYDMSYLFSGCSNLVTLTLSGWDTSQVTSMENIFGDCSRLATIYVGNGWTSSHVSVFDTLFGNCTSLVGGNGTRWDSSHVDRTYARIDASSSPGYLTGMSVESYAVYNNSTLTFYCDQLRTSRTGTSYDLPTGSNAPGWSDSSVAGNITSVVFDPSFANARPQSTYRWFRNMSNITTLTGLENLNTSQVTVMSEMFYGCTQLESLDLSGWNTFNATGMSGIFRGCSALTNLDLTNWDTHRVTDMSNMFRECSALKTIYVGSNWSTQAITNSSNMFTNCTQLVGGNGTLYDASHVNASYACVDSPTTPGYLRDHSQDHNVNLVLTAGACDKGIEVWSDNTQVGSVSQEGGTFWGEIENAQSLQLRVPSQYLEKIILNSTDVTATLPSTTPDDPAYAGYTFYTLADLTEFMVIEVQYNDNVPHPFETSEIRFDCLNGTGSLKIMKVWFEDGTYLSDNMGHLGINWLEMRTVSRIEVTMQPDLDNFTYAQQYNTLGTIVNNGDGTYSYTIPGENLTSSIVPLYFPTSNYGSVKTLISSRNNIKLGYYFGELAIYDGGFLPQYAQENSSLQNSEVTIMHKNNAEPGWDVDQTKGIIYIQVPQGTTFRLVEDGVDHTADCVWYGAGQRLNEISNDYDFYMTPVAGYYYLLKNVTTDSYIVVDNGNGEIVSPWQITQNISVIGDGTLSLLNSENAVVGSATSAEPATVSIAKGDNLTLAVTLPDGANIDNYEAALILDGTYIELQKTDGAFATFNMGSINTAHNIVLITRQVGGFVNTNLLTQHIQLTGEQLGSVWMQYLDSDGADYDDAYAGNEDPYVTFTSEDKIYIKGAKPCITVPDGYTFKVWFNGQEVTGFTLEDNSNVATLGESFITDGTWVVEFKKQDIIEFADNNVKAICVANWDTNGDGELSKAEAAAVTTLKVMNEARTVYASPFKNNAVITSFDELQYFTLLTEIADSAFYSCSALKSVKLPQQITSLNSCVFYNCTLLEELQLPNGLKTIGDWALRYCSSLRTFFVPASVTSIPIHALGGCSGLHSVVVDPANTKYDSRNGCNAIIETSSNTVIDGCRNTVLPEGIAVIGGFQSQTEMKTFVIPSTVTYIGSGNVTYAFSGCTKLEKIISKAKVPFGRSYECFRRFASNCVLVVPYGTRQAYIDAGFSESVFPGGIVEDKSQYDTNQDGSVSIADVTTLVNVILGKPIQ